MTTLESGVKSTSIKATAPSIPTANIGRASPRKQLAGRRSSTRATPMLSHRPRFVETDDRDRRASAADDPADRPPASPTAREPREDEEGRAAGRRVEPQPLVAGSGAAGRGTAPVDERLELGEADDGEVVDERVALSRPGHDPLQRRGDRGRREDQIARNPKPMSTIHSAASMSTMPLRRDACGSACCRARECRRRSRPRSATGSGTRAPS